MCLFEQVDLRVHCTVTFPHFLWQWALQTQISAPVCKFIANIYLRRTEGQAEAQLRRRSVFSFEIIAVTSHPEQGHL